MPYPTDRPVNLIQHAINAAVSRLGRPILIEHRDPEMKITRFLSSSLSISESGTPPNDYEASLRMMESLLMEQLFAGVNTIFHR